MWKFQEFLCSFFSRTLAFIFTYGFLKKFSRTHFCFHGQFFRNFHGRKINFTDGKPKIVENFHGRHFDFHGEKRKRCTEQWERSGAFYNLIAESRLGKGIAMKLLWKLGVHIQKIHRTGFPNEEDGNTERPRHVCLPGGNAIQITLKQPKSRLWYHLRTRNQDW